MQSLQKSNVVSSPQLTVGTTRSPCDAQYAPHQRLRNTLYSCKTDAISRYTLKPVVVKEEMHHAVIVLPVIGVGFVKADQQQIIKISGFLLKFRNFWNAPSAIARELIAQHDLTCPVVVIFLCYNTLPVCKIVFCIQRQT